MPGLFSVLEKGSHPLTTLNVSEGGVLFHAEEPLPTGAFVKVQLALPPSGEPVECAVRVMRVVGARGGFEIGTQIIHMPPRAPAPLPPLPEASSRRARSPSPGRRGAGSRGRPSRSPGSRRRRRSLDTTLPLIPVA